VLSFVDQTVFVVYARDGNITLDAITWLIKHNVQISILTWDGRLLTTMLPPESVQVKTKFSQYDAYKDNKERLFLSRKFLEAKFDRTQLVLSWLKERYPEVKDDFSKELPLFRKAKTISEMMMVEGRIASFYWQEIVKVIPDEYEFKSRKWQKKPWGAGDKVNCMLNYGYALLEAECMRSINTAGLDVHVGFLHEMNIGKNSLAYDFQEPYRFLVDLAVLSLIEKNEMKKSDFIRTENYTLKLRPSGAKKLVSEINTWINKKADYGGKQCTWSYILLSKTRELVHYLVGKKKIINFSTPEYSINRQDSEDVRKKILSIKYTDWKKLGYSKGTLHYMKENARSPEPFTLNEHVRERLSAWEKLVSGIKAD